MSVTQDLHCQWYLKILSQLHEPVSGYNLKEFLNIGYIVNPELLEVSYDMNERNYERSRVKLHCGAN